MTDDTELDDILETFIYDSSYQGEIGPEVEQATTEAKQALLAWSERREATARLDELESLDTRRHYGKDYQDSLDELDEYKDKRLSELTSDRTGGGEGQE